MKKLGQQIQKVMFYQTALGIVHCMEKNTCTCVRLYVYIKSYCFAHSRHKPASHIAVIYRGSTSPRSLTFLLVLLITIIIIIIIIIIIVIITTTATQTQIRERDIHTKHKQHTSHACTAI